MKLIIGLGNPGEEYEKTRHNIGFAVADELARQFGIEIRHKKFNGLLGETRQGEEKVFLFKPFTYMNRSGVSVSAICGFYGLNSDSLMVVHDDLDLSLGQVKFARGRGTAGHRGVESIVEELGSVSFDRLRVGIGRPPANVDPADYVLQPFMADEAAVVSEAICRCAEALKGYLEYGIEWAMERYHRKNGKESGS